MQSNKTKTLTAALYVRVSTEEQAKEGYSIPAQIEVLTDYCKLYKIKIYHTYKDLGISGKSMRIRPGLQELIGDAKKGLFDTVLVWKTNRLARNLKELLILVDEFEQQGISFISYSEHFDTSTPVGRMTMQILGSIGEFERNTIVENVKLGLNQRFKSGKTIGKIAYGYKSINKQLVIVEDEARVVRKMFDLCISMPDAGYKKIAFLLNAEGCRTRKGKLWAGDTVEDVLKNPVYIGRLRHDIKHNIKGEDYHEVDGLHEAIIEEDVFYKVQDKLSSKGGRIGNIKGDNDYFLVGLLRCPLCGGSMIKRENRGYRYYQCLTYHRYGRDGCSGLTVSANHIEQEFIEKLRNATRSKETIQKIINDARTKKTVEIQPLQAKVENIQEEIDRLEENRDRYFSLFDNKQVDSSLFVDKLNQLTSQLNMLQERRKELIEQQKMVTFRIPDDEIVRYLENFIPEFDQADMVDKKRWLKIFIKEIRLTTDKKLERITFNTPMDGLSIL